MRRKWLTVSIACLTATFTMLVGAPVAAAAAPATVPTHATGALWSGKIITPVVPFTLTGLPDAWDLSAATVPVGNQGSVGSCTTWAINYAMAGWYSRFQPVTGGAGLLYAPMFTYSQIHVDNTPGGGGSFPSDAYRIWQTQGDDTQDDYWQGNYNWWTLPTPAQIAHAGQWKAGPMRTLYSGTPGVTGRDVIKEAIYKFQPVALSIPVYSAFDRLNSSDYTLDASEISGSSLGLHEVLIVAYTPQGVRIQNSWGTGWGQAGFANLNWNFLEQYSLEATVTTGLIEPPMWPPTVSHTPVSNGKTTLVWTDPQNFGGSPLTGWTLTRTGLDSDGHGQQAWTLPPSARTFVLDKLNNGTVYTVFVQASNKIGTGLPNSVRITVPEGVPSPPLNVRATQVAPGKVKVDWAPPAGDGGQPIGFYVVTGEGPTGRTWDTVSSTNLSYTSSNLADGATYRFNVSAVNTYGEGPARSASVKITNRPAGAFVSLPSFRLLDTRKGVGVSTGPIAARSAVAIPVVGKGGLPSSDASPVVLTVQVANPAKAGYLTVYADGTARPRTANLLFAAGRTIANTVVAKPGSNGKIAFYNSSGGTVDVIAYITGYYTAGNPSRPGTYGPVTPSRVIDTLTGVGVPRGPMAAASTFSTVIAGRGGVPTVANGTGVVLLNVTANSAAKPGALIAYQTGTVRPTAATVTFPAGRPGVNLAAVPVSPSGRISVYNKSGSAVQVTIDVLGWFVSGHPTDTGALVTLPPATLFDTRTGVGGHSGAVASRQAMTVRVTGRSGIPSSGVAAVVIGLTGQSPSASGYVTAWPQGVARPGYLQAIFSGGNPSTAFVIVPIASNGSIAVYNGAPEPAQISADVIGYVRS